ncbi:SDR family oxidoreductase [Nocardioides insulae]|uniref:SDR family oxidoreductase n=1 Tax=Nocardioides insulae TaxID=394734 RepID=UPI0004286769|nr:SDR family oxidoreductase [Nocardioides insulae]
MVGLISGATALVTGAGSGIGRAVVRQLASRGAAIALLDQDAEAVGLVGKEASELGAARVVELAADVSDRVAVQDAFRSAADELGPLDALACAAGILVPGGLTEVTPDEWQRHFDVNTTGVLHCLQSGTPLLRDDAAVVVVSSNAARVPRTGMLAYAASKAATSALTRCAGLELAARGIRCNVVEPGSTDTAMLRELWRDPDGGASATLAGDPASYRVGIPLQRIAEPDDVAAMVCFLLSEEARHVTLQQIYVDGGASL